MHDLHDEALLSATLCFCEEGCTPGIALCKVHVGVVPSSGARETNGTVVTFFFSHSYRSLYKVAMSAWRLRMDLSSTCVVLKVVKDLTRWSR